MTFREAGPWVVSAESEHNPGLCEIAMRAPDYPAISNTPNRKCSEELPLWLSGLKTRYGVQEDVGSIPGLAQWVKDLALR